jgi:hypothetical protein
MPIFLLPIVVGGYYYLKSRSEEQAGVNTKDLDASSSSETPTRAALEDDCPSIEVSLVSDWDRHQSGRCEPSWQDPPDDDDDRQVIKGLQSRVLSRKESLDTAQTEVSEEFEATRQHSTETSEQFAIDCYQGFFFEIVDCGKRSDCDADTITTFRRDVSVEC